MSVRDDMAAAQIAAQKERDTRTLSTLRLVLSAIKNEQIKRQKGLSGAPAPEGAPGQAKDQDGRLYEIIKAEADRMILETQRSMDYYRAQFREGSVKKIVLMGGACLMPGFQEYFATYFDANVELDDPFAEILCDEAAFGEIRLIAPRFSTAVGLALREADA